MRDCIFGIITFIVASLLLVGFGVFAIISDYQYSRDIGSYWSLSDKASSIEKKSEYLDLYVAALEAAGLDGEYIPDILFDNNLIALKSLQQRMHDILEMDVQSFEYQMAIQQITGQEQGEAGDMISLFKSIWYKNNYFLLWNWVAVIPIVILSILWFVGGSYWLDVC